MFAQISEHAVAVTLYTDAYVINGTVTSRHGRVTDILNTAVEAFIVLSDVTMDEWGSTASPVRADFAQVNLASVLFAVADEAVEATPELRMPKITEQALHHGAPVPRRRDDPPAARAEHAARAERAHRTVPARHRRDVLVRHRRRGASRARSWSR